MAMKAKNIKFLGGSVMKINYSADFKPEEIEQIFDVGMRIANKIIGLYTEETQKTETEEIKEQVGEIDKKIDKLGTKIEDFREVVTKTSPKK